MWLPEDTEAALDWAEWKQGLCSGCGQPRHESFDPRGPEYQIEALECRACAARDRKAEAWRSNEHAELHGIQFVIRQDDEPDDD